MVRSGGGRARRRRQSAGLSHSDGLESQFSQQKTPSERMAFLLAEDEGFEPPQTESESGVLPLHKSSI